MKIQTTAPDLVSSNVQSQGSFKIKNSAKAFSILSSGLYSNKIKAIIRELSCNAVDSHKEANTDVPFKVHLPNSFEPYFSVTDYGIGLDHEGVTQLYTTYFESTKQDSNDYIGALGLGSKSPFSYTDNFTVTAIKDGVSRIYTAYIDETGCPAIALMGESETEDGNGVEVKFSVNERYDFYQFVQEAKEVFKWFEKKPEVTGNSDYSHDYNDVKEYSISERVHLLNDDSYYARPIAVQGNIAYPVHLPDMEGIEDIQSLLRCALVMEFDIGELDVSASREELSYIQLTVDNIVARLRQVSKDVEGYVRKELDSIKNQWDLAFRMQEMANTTLFKSSILNLVDSGYCKILKRHNKNIYVAPEELAIKGEYLKKRGVTIRQFQVDTSYSGNIVRNVNADSGYDNTTKQVETTHHVPFSKNTIFVLNDTKKGVLARVKYHFKNEHIRRNTNIVVISADRDNFENRDKLFKNILRKLHNPPVTKMSASELKERDRLKQVRTSLLRTERQEVYKSYQYRYITKFVKVSPDYEIDPNKTYYYVPVSNFTPINARGEKEDSFLERIWDRVKTAELITGNPTLYGVRKSAINDLKDEPNWINVYDLIPELVNKIDTSVIYNSIYKSTVDNTVINCYTTHTDRTTKLSTDSPFRIFAEKAHGPITTSISSDLLDALKFLLAKYGHDTSFEKESTEIKAEYRALFDTYPMLQFVRSGYSGTDTSDRANHMIDYINLIDEQRSKN